jgi:hypothetical protein
MTYGYIVAGGLLLLLLAGLETGYRLGRRVAERGDAQSGGQVGAIQGAVLGLLGLLLGFSFAGAAGRFIERQDLIVTEANAIGTAWLRADLLDEPYRAQLKDELARYVRHRIEGSQRLREGLREADKAEIAAFHDRIWRAARDGVLAQPTTMVVVLPPVNDVIDLHATRVAAGRKHLPVLILGLLIACSVLGISVIGYGCGLSRRRAFPMTAALAVLISAALWTTIDLDHPRRGLLQLSDAPLRELNLNPVEPATQE